MSKKSQRTDCLSYAREAQAQKLGRENEEKAEEELLAAKNAKKEKSIAEQRQAQNNERILAGSGTANIGSATE